MFSKLKLVVLVMLGVWSLSAQAERSFNLATPVVILMPYVLPNAELLEITPDQAQQIRLIYSKVNPEREDNELFSEELRKELWELLSSSIEPDQAELQELVQLISKAEQRRVAMSVECATQLRTILTPSQWQLLVGLAADVQ
ncbi:MAG: hypothetical protein IBX48_06635 [Thiomicrospira sp.]|uniref:hypothetical protein n=1 Tax=Thiomicrospira sp. TaxID=935 RepID=UPI001A0324A0|nr:hypothetical protein [Thiomicrospira sp.]MBE0494003.1 hypothetical protein [Thiomicrospira sp.]